VVAGSRYMPGGRQLGGPRLKALMSRVAGLTLHWFGGIPVHDATSNFRLYRRSYLETVTIQSRAGFELALELTVKATLAGPRLAGPWRDRPTARPAYGPTGKPWKRRVARRWIQSGGCVTSPGTRASEVGSP